MNEQMNDYSAEVHNLGRDLRVWTSQTLKSASHVMQRDKTLIVDQHFNVLKPSENYEGRRYGCRWLGLESLNL